MALYLKYRPRDFDSLIWQDFISNTLKQSCKGDKLVWAYLLCGPRWTGKTSTARILAKAVNCLDKKDWNPCNNCNGSGKNQTSKKISVTIPKGVDDGTRIRLAGKGEAGVKGGGNGDLYLFINVRSHDLFKRSEENLFFEYPISIADAALGTSLEIPTIDGAKAKIKIPAGTQTGKQFRLKGKGMPYMRGSGNGDLYVQINTEVPISLNKEQKELLEKFRKIENEKSNPSIKKFFQKAKSFWKN